MSSDVLQKLVFIFLLSPHTNLLSVFSEVVFQIGQMIGLR